MTKQYTNEELISHMDVAEAARYSALVDRRNETAMQLDAARVGLEAMTQRVVLIELGRPVPDSDDRMVVTGEWEARHRKAVGNQDAAVEAIGNLERSLPAQDQGLEDLRQRVAFRLDKQSAEEREVSTLARAIVKAMVDAGLATVAT